MSQLHLKIVEIKLFSHFLSYHLLKLPFSLFFFFFNSQFKVLMTCLTWEFLRSGTCDGNLMNVIYLESDLWPSGVREAGKSKGKRLSKDGVSTVMAGDSGTQITPWLHPWGKEAGSCNPVPVKLGRAVSRASGDWEALRVDSQSCWELGGGTGRGRVPTPSMVFMVRVDSRAHAV